jgi:glycopeptide antibiotics resistance protein
MQLALILYLAFVIYGSLVPFHFSPRSLADAIDIFSRIPFLQLGVDSRADWVANVLLFIPLAYLAAQVIPPLFPRFIRIFGYAAIVIACFVLALTIEFAQIFFPPRTVSQNDIIAESLGAIIGLFTYATLGPRVNKWLVEIWQMRSGQGRAINSLHVYLTILLVFNVLPLDLTLSAAEIYRKWAGHQLNLIPFAGWTLDAERLYELLTDILIWIPIGVLWRLLGHSLVSCLIRGITFAAGVEFLQLFVVSRTTDVTDIILAGIGTWLGVRLMGENRRSFSWPSGPVVSLMIGCWLLVIFVLFWYPFNFQFESGAKVPHRMLFETYYYTSEYHAINELLRKAGTFIPGGLVLALGCRRLSTRASLVLAFLLFGLIAAAIEGGQMFLPGKVADVTDWLLETIGGILGVLTGRWIFGLFDLAGSSAAIAINATTPKPQTSKADTSPNRSGVESLPHPHRGPFEAAEIISLALFSATIYIVLRLPFVPYNIRELLPGGFQGIVSALLIAIGISWLYGSHVTFLSWAAQISQRGLWIPAWLGSHAVLMAAIVTLAVPTESLYDLVGSPILGWPPGIEPFLRFMALDISVGLAVLGAAAMVLVYLQPRRIVLSISWLFSTGLLMPILYWVIVIQAASDNLTELMKDGGSLSSIVALGLAMLLMALSGGLLCITFLNRQRRLLAVIVALAGMPLTYALLQLGLEDTIIKYDNVFSALQFLLSRDRSHYATGLELFARFAFAYLALLVVIIAVQLGPWRKVLGKVHPTKHPRGAA